MAQRYAIVVLVSIVSLSRGIQVLPSCSQLGKYALPREMQEDLATKVLVHEPKRDASVSLVYQCALEGMAGLILENPHKPLTCPHSLGMHALVFDIGDEPDIDVKVMNKAAINTWKDHIPHVSFATSFGCNYRKEHGLHRYLCLLK